MRDRFRLATAALLALTAVCTPAVAGASAAPRAGHRVRELRVSSPAPGDIAVLFMRFPHVQVRLSSRTVRIGVAGLFADDFLAAAVPRGAGDLVLALLADRPTRAEEPSFLRLRLVSAARLGAPRIHELADPFTRPPGAPSGVCSLTRARSPLTGVSLGPLGSHGEGLHGFAAAEAVARGYDAVCGLPYPVAFRRAVAGAGAQCPAGSSCEPAPEPPPVPLPPGPPKPEPPRCPPCPPPRAYACPLVVSPVLCPAVAA